VVGIDDYYTAFCFDEACMFLLNALENEKEIIFKTSDNVSQTKHYSSFSEMYKSFGVGE
jgi:hypothetical protein